MADAGGRRPEGAGDPGDRVESLARELAQRESARRADRDRAEALAAQLHELARAAVSRFARAVRDAGAPHLDLVRVDPVEPDDKSIRAFQFRIRRGRFEAIVVCKDRGEVMLVGPFRRGGEEGPCDPIHLTSAPDPLAASAGPVEELVAKLIEAAFTR